MIAVREVTEESMARKGRKTGYQLPHLRAWRQYRGLSTKELAEQADIGVSTLSRLEHGRQNASIGLIALLADVLSITRAQLLSESPYRDEPPRE